MSDDFREFLDRREIKRRKRRANDRVSYAVRVGKLKRQPCVICGSLNTYAHHPDYSRPLVVVWLCPLHHSHIHKDLTVGMIDLG
jgi:hypothetical protein